LLIGGGRATLPGDLSGGYYVHGPPHPGRPYLDQLLPCLSRPRCIRRI
jgi:hypothetical protein